MSRASVASGMSLGMPAGDLVSPTSCEACGVGAIVDGKGCGCVGWEFIFLVSGVVEVCCREGVVLV